MPRFSLVSCSVSPTARGHVSLSLVKSNNVAPNQKMGYGLHHRRRFVTRLPPIAMASSAVPIPLYITSDSIRWPNSGALAAGL